MLGGFLSGNRYPVSPIIHLKTAQEGEEEEEKSVSTHSNSLI